MSDTDEIRPEPRELTMREVSAMGGQANKKKYEGTGHFNVLGTMGGLARVRGYGPQGMIDAGKRSGVMRLLRIEAEERVAQARKGGEKTKEKHGNQHFSELARKSHQPGAKRKRKIDPTTPLVDELLADLDQKVAGE